MSRKAISKSKNRSAVTRRKTRVFPGEANPLGGLNWRLPSGEGLLDFALRSGFLAPPLLGSVGERLKQRFRRIP